MAEALDLESRALAPGHVLRVARLAAALMGAYEAGRVAEREACAKLVEDTSEPGALARVAAAIRARGKVKP